MRAARPLISGLFEAARRASDCEHSPELHPSIANDITRNVSGIAHVGVSSARQWQPHINRALDVLMKLPAHGERQDLQRSSRLIGSSIWQHLEGWTNNLRTSFPTNTPEIPALVLVTDHITRVGPTYDLLFPNRKKVEEDFVSIRRLDSEFKAEDSLSEVMTRQAREHLRPESWQYHQGDHSLYVMKSIRRIVSGRQSSEQVWRTEYRLIIGGEGSRRDVMERRLPEDEQRSIRLPRGDGTEEIGSRVAHLSLFWLVPHGQHGATARVATWNLDLRTGRQLWHVGFAIDFEEMMQTAHPAVWEGFRQFANREPNLRNAPRRA